MGRRVALCLVGLLVAGGSWLVESAAAQADLADQEERAIKAAVATVAPAVVRIETVGGLEKVGKALASAGPTTGLIVDADGYIISSAFNFIHQPTSILVTLPGGKKAAAQIVARDHARMLVLLKVKTDESLAPPAAVPRSEMTVGQWAIAVGRTFDQPLPSASVGVLSALNRIWGRAVQTDAKISPHNYGGPLIDIRGRVLGVLAPLSPQGQGSEVAGAEWYDSGIGFAVPLADILERLPRLKSGQDLHPGLLGVSLKPGDIYATPPEIAACPPNTPAGAAGLKKGDVIVEADGQPIARQAQLRHVLGAHYAGDKLRVTVLRGTERVTAEIELAEKLEPYQHPFLGLLPRRHTPPGSVVIRHVYPDSPAEQAGLKAGERIVACDDKPVADAASLAETIATRDWRQKARLTVEREGERRTVELDAARLPETLPGELPPAVESLPAPPAERPAVGVVEIKLPEEKNECLALVPENYHPDVPHGVIVWLPPPGPLDRDAFAQQWQTLCQERQFLVLAPRPADPKKWEPTEAAFVRKTLDNVLAAYNVDRSRIALVGQEAGGTLAFMVLAANPDLIRAAALVDAPPPLLTRLPDNDPILPLAFYLAVAKKSPAAAGVGGLRKRLADAKFPVVFKDLGDEPRPLSADELAELVRWLDTLDRI